MSSGPVETELRQPFRRREKLRLSLHLQRNIPPMEPAKVMEPHIRTIDANELARKLNLHQSSMKVPFLLLDCRGYLCYTDCHIRGAVHIACTDRFNRKRVQNAGASVLDLVCTNNRRNKSGCPMSSTITSGKLREVIVYDEGVSDLNLEDSTWSNPTSFVIAHLIRENRQPIYLNGGIKEFSRYYSELCENFRDHSDLSSMETTVGTSLTVPALSFFPSQLLPTPSSTSSQAVCSESYENEPPTQVLPFLYVGNARDANDSELLRKLGIRYVLSVTTTCPLLFKNSMTRPESKSNLIEKPIKEPEFHTKLIPVSDNLIENLAPYFEEACDFIEEARKSGTRVLIHCHAGISRSPTIAIAYIMKHINMSTLEAYALVQKYRRIISPNLNFMGQLVEYETKLKGYGNSSDSSCSTSTSSESSDTSSTRDSLTDDFEINLIS